MRSPARRDIPQWWAWFVLGGVLLPLASLRFAVQPLAWVGYAPFLVVLFRTGGVRVHAALAAILLVSLHLAIGKIVTPPLTFWFVPVFAVPAALAVFAALTLSGWAARRRSLRWGVYLFPALTVGAEGIQYSFTGLSAWGALAFTQTHDIALIQLSSLTGITGVSFVVALGSSLVAGCARGGLRAFRPDVVGFGVIFIAAHLWGEMRIGTNNVPRMVRVAVVASPFASEEVRASIRDLSSLRAGEDALFERTRTAARLGARIAVWNEVATLVAPEDEQTFVARARALATDASLDLVMAYGVLESASPLRFQNKYRWVRADGSLADEYFKRFPVPGEGSIAGTALSRIVELDGVRFAGAICYDFDFPIVSRSIAVDGAHIVVLPSSDWRGIDPLHSEMARMMAVATGVSVVRSVRGATSFSSDPYGRVTGAMRFNESPAGVMVSDVPVGGRRTLYASIGDVFPTTALMAAAITLLLVAWGVIRSSAVAVGSTDAAAQQHRETQNSLIASDDATGTRP
jgi:apolipoprotein N-acyltransferase